AEQHGARQLGQERDADAAAARSEVEDAPRVVSPARRLAMAKRGLDERLGLGPRHERRDRELERETPELAGAENTSERLSGKTPCRERGEAGRGLSEGSVALCHEIGAIETASGFDEAARLERGARDAPGGELSAKRCKCALRRLIGAESERWAPGQAASSSTIARSAAWRSVTSASISSSRATPSSTSFSLFSVKKIRWVVTRPWRQV